MKNSFTKLYGLVAILLSGALVFNSCKDDDDDEQKSPVIELINPAEGQIGETVTISGENFTAEGKTTKVKFGTTEVTPTENTVSTITVKVPELEPGNVDVMVSCGEQASAPKTFKVLKVQPIEFSDFEPKKGKYQTEISITGKNFNDKVKVYINGKEQTEKTVNSEGTEIKVKLAKQTGSGKIVLKRDGEDDKELETELEYEFSYDVSEFANMKVYGMAFSKDGKIYASTNNKEVVELDSEGTVKETLLEYEFGFERIFIANDGMVYIASGYEFVLSYNPDNKEVDTVAKDGNTTQPWDVVGDNNNYLYLTTRASKKVVKIDIRNKSTDVVTTTNNKTTGICLKGDSLFVLTYDSFFSLHKNGGDKRFILNSTDGYKFNISGICTYPTGDLFITGDSKGNLYKMDTKYQIKEAITATQLNISDTRNIVQDNNGNLYIIGDKILKVKVE